MLHSFIEPEFYRKKLLKDRRGLQEKRAISDFKADVPPARSTTHDGHDSFMVSVPLKRFKVQ